MNLFYRKMGQGDPLIILHGLYGSSDNWLNIGKELSDEFTVYILDQRNHGHSSHAESHTYPDMREDLSKFMKSNNLDKAHILGHSMGGKTAAYFALKYPEKVERLIVVDIMPTPYNPDDSAPQVLSHKIILKALQNIQLKSIQTLKDADKELKKSIPYKQVRQFLLKNLKRNDNGQFYWLLNLDILVKELPSIMDGIEVRKLEDGENRADLPTLFIKGENSDYIKDEDKDTIRKIFPKAMLTTIKGAGHWVHAEKRKEFLFTVKNFLKS